MTERGYQAVGEGQAAGAPSAYHKSTAARPTQPLMVSTPAGPSKNNTQPNRDRAVQPEPYEGLICSAWLACLCCAWICGIPAVIYAYNAEAAHGRQDYDEYHRQRSKAKTWILISVVIGIGLIIFYAIDYNSLSGN